PVLEQICDAKQKETETDHRGRLRHPWRSNLSGSAVRQKRVLRLLRRERVGYVKHLRRDCARLPAINVRHSSRNGRIHLRIVNLNAINAYFKVKTKNSVEYK